MGIKKRLRLKKRNNEGIIRSHSNFPWAYTKVLFSYHTDHKIVFNLKGKYMRKRILLVSVRVLSICETEELTFRTSKTVARRYFTKDLDSICNTNPDSEDNKRIGPINETQNSCNWSFRREDKSLEIRFRGSNETLGCEGFLVCYKGTYIYHIPIILNK